MAFGKCITMTAIFGSYFKVPPSWVRQMPLLFFASLAACTAHADANCEDGTTTILHAEASEVAGICASAREARKALRTCGLELDTAIRIIVARTPISDDPRCLAAYHCDRDEVSILPVDEALDRVASNRLLSLIEAEDLQTSLLTHEFVHAAISRSDFSDRVSLIEDEYIAYALQFDALPVATQEALRGLVIPSQAESKQVLSELLLAVDPSLFGLLAWRHFDRDGNGCRYVDDLLNGRKDLDPPDLFDHP